MANIRCDDMRLPYQNVAATALARLRPTSARVIFVTFACPAFRSSVKKLVGGCKDLGESQGLDSYIHVECRRYDGACGRHFEDSIWYWVLINGYNLEGFIRKAW